MYEGSMRSCRQDEWSELVLLVMKTSLSVAHELGLPPEAVLDCAARHLLFRDFPSFASAIQGAARAHAFCCRRDGIPAIDVAYIKTLAARVDIDRNVLAWSPTMCTSALLNDVGAPAQVFEKVAAAVKALKEDVRRVFSLANGAFSNEAAEAASDFAEALAAIMPADDKSGNLKRAFAAVLHVRFTAQVQLAPVNEEHARHHQCIDGPLAPMHTSSVQGGWMQRVKNAMHHPARPHNQAGVTTDVCRALCLGNRSVAFSLTTASLENT